MKILANKNGFTKHISGFETSGLFPLCREKINSEKSMHDAVFNVVNGEQLPSNLTE